MAVGLGVRVGLGVQVGQGVRVGLGVLVCHADADEPLRTEALSDNVGAEAAAPGTVVQVRTTAARPIAKTEMISAFERDIGCPFPDE